MNIQIGADPELFVQHKGEVVSGHGLIPGTKKEPHVVNNGAVQVDGMALEFNINPAASEDEFVFNIDSVLTQLSAMIPDHNLMIEATAEFDPDYMATQPKEALELGCEPDFNAYTIKMNPAPNANVNFRTAAGHIHIGWGEDMNVNDQSHLQICSSLTKQLDLFLGLPSMLFDDDQKRRQLYGKAGAFRPKSYGAEYRVLSNKWLANQDLMRFIYRNTQKAVSALMEGNDLFEVGFNKARDIINNGTAEDAKKYLKEIKEIECHV